MSERRRDDSDFLCAQWAQARNRTEGGGGMESGDVTSTGIRCPLRAPQDLREITLGRQISPFLLGGWFSSPHGGRCMSFFGSITNYHTWWFKTRESLFYLSSGGQKSKIKYRLDHIPSRDSKGDSVPFLSGFWWPTAFLGLWPNHSTLCLCLHVAFSSL